MTQMVELVLYDLHEGGGGYPSSTSRKPRNNPAEVGSDAAATWIPNPVALELNGDERYHGWRVSCDGSKIGALSRTGVSETESLQIWSFGPGGCTHRHHNHSSGIVAYCFTPAGSNVVIGCRDGAIEVWDAKDGSEVTVDAAVRLGRSDSNGNKRIKDLCLTAGPGGGGTVVALTECGMLHWIDLDDECLVHTAQTQFRDNVDCRFSADGRRCVVGCARGPSVEVWDLVQRTVRHTHLQLPEPLASLLGALNFQQQVSVNGDLVLLGANQDEGHWILPKDGMSGWEDFKLWSNCCRADYEQFCVLGPIGALSEDGKFAAHCVPVKESMFRIYAHTFDGKSDEPEQMMSFCAEGELDGRMLLSGNGHRVVWITDRKVRVWNTLWNVEYTLNYAELKEGGHLHHDQVLALLENCGNRLWNHTDQSGWTFLARAVHDGNSELLSWVIDWAGQSETSLPLHTEIPDHVKGGVLYKNLVQVAAKNPSPDCLDLLIDGVLSGCIKCDAGKILGESIPDLIDTHPGFLQDIICSPKLMQKTGEVLVLGTRFRNEPFLVCTSDSLSPTDLNELWSNPTPQLATLKPWRRLQMAVWRGLRRCLSSGKEDSMGSRHKVPAESFVIPVAGLAQAGPSSVSGKVVSKCGSAEALSSHAMKAVTKLKWDAFGQELMYNKLFQFVHLLLLYTKYAMILGHGCHGKDHLPKMGQAFSAICLVASIVTSIHALYHEFHKMAAYIKAGRGAGYYWRKSVWNAPKFLMYILCAVVTPALHFTGNPCSQRSGLTIIVPLTIILVWWMPMYFARVARSTGPVLLMVFGIMKDVFLFVLMGFRVLLGFGFAFFVLFRGDEAGKEAFGSMTRSMMTVSAMPFGNFDWEVLYSSPAPALAVALFAAYILVMAILLFNLLIAVIGDGFDRIKSTEKDRLATARALFLDDLEATLSKTQKRKIGEGTGRYVHVLVPKNRLQAPGKWQGKIVELESRFKRIAAESRGELDTVMQDRIDKLGHLMKQQIGFLEESMKRRINVVEDRLEGTPQTPRDVGDFKAR